MIYFYLIFFIYFSDTPPLVPDLDSLFYWCFDGLKTARNKCLNLYLHHNISSETRMTTSISSEVKKSEEIGLLWSS